MLGRRATSMRSHSTGEQHLADWVMVLDRLAETMQGFANEAQGCDFQQTAQARQGKV